MIIPSLPLWMNPDYNAGYEKGFQDGVNLAKLEMKEALKSISDKLPVETCTISFRNKEFVKEEG